MGFAHAFGQNVGIGTNNPAAKLDVFHNDDIWHAYIGGSTGRLQIGGQNKNGAVIQSWNPSTSQPRDLYLQRDGGNVGIGTTAIAAKLEIEDNNPAEITPTVRINSNTKGNAMEVFQNGGAANGINITNLGIGGRKFGLYSGVYDNLGISIAIVGIAGDDGMKGNIVTDDKVGVEGINRNAASGYGVSGKSKAPTGAGVLASYIGTGTGNALIVDNGFIKVSGTNRTAFQVITSNTNTTNNYTSLTYMGASATDIVTVTPVYEGTYLKSPIGLWFFSNEWRVFRQDEVAMPYGVKFNVIVMKQ